MSIEESQGISREKRIATIMTNTEDEEAAFVDALLAAFAELGCVVGYDDSMAFPANICPCDKCKAERGRR